MNKTIFLAAAAFAFFGAGPALADEHGGHHGRERGDHRGGSHQVYREHGDHQNHGGGQRQHRGDYRNNGYPPRVQGYVHGYRDAQRQDYREDRRIYRDGYYDGRRQDFGHDYRIYRDRYYDNRRGGYYDGRRYASYSYRPYFQPFYQYDRPYYRYDQYDAAWNRPYVIGRPLPGHLRYTPIRDGYYDGLPPCPNGYYYANVGGDILLLSLASNLIVDALLFGSRY